MAVLTGGCTAKVQGHYPGKKNNASTLKELFNSNTWDKFQLYK